MRIIKIIVKNLFGMFHHEIPMNMADRITIIHGPNGFGKTVLLTMVNALFGRRYWEIRRIPFGELSIDFNDGSILRLIKSKNGNDELVFSFRRKRSQPQSYKVVKSLKREEEFRYPLEVIHREIPGLERVGPESWIYTPTQETLSLEDIFERFGRQLMLPLAPHRRGEEEPNWLKEIRNSIPVRFIESQRLLSFPSPRRYREREREPSIVPAVINYSEELAQTIQAKLTEYAALSQSLDRTFPTRLVKGNGSSALKIDELRTNLSELEKKRTRLMEAGLLDKEKEIDFPELRAIGERNRSVLSVYIEDVKKKLGVFDELTNKIDLLVKILNSRFFYKQMSISKKEGFIFKTSTGRDVPPTKLSSGEQHELVLLYELLFKVNPDSLILIDEPELSLHVVWQQQFLKDLQEITKLIGFDVLIATHSPQIIHDRWDLTVELKGPQN